MNWAKPSYEWGYSASSWYDLYSIFVIIISWEIPCYDITYCKEFWLHINTKHNKTNCRVIINKRFADYRFILSLKTLLGCARYFIFSYSMDVVFTSPILQMAYHKIKLIYNVRVIIGYISAKIISSNKQLLIRKAHSGVKLRPYTQHFCTTWDRQQNKLCHLHVHL